uniref:Uncharacterized protein n=1 Tax=Romanomermis culicivorax TaxID=13658 RepID=A0A915KAJ8_ROMCU
VLQEKIVKFGKKRQRRVLKTLIRKTPNLPAALMALFIDGEKRKWSCGPGMSCTTVTFVKVEPSPKVAPLGEGYDLRSGCTIGANVEPSLHFDPQVKLFLLFCMEPKKNKTSAIQK